MINQDQVAATRVISVIVEPGEDVDAWILRLDHDDWISPYEIESALRKAHQMAAKNIQLSVEWEEGEG